MFSIGAIASVQWDLIVAGVNDDVLSSHQAYPTVWTYREEHGEP